MNLDLTLSLFLQHYHIFMHFKADVPDKEYGFCSISSPSQLKTIIQRMTKNFTLLGIQYYSQTYSYPSLSYDEKIN